MSGWFFRHPLGRIIVGNTPGDEVVKLTFEDTDASLGNFNFSDHARANEPLEGGE